jgi:hypothetical protein
MRDLESIPNRRTYEVWGYLGVSWGTVYKVLGSLSRWCKCFFSCTIYNSSISVRRDSMRKLFMPKFILAIMFIFGLTACGGFQQLESNHDFGPQPTGYKDKITAYYAYVLKDPESAKYRFGKPYKAYTNAGLAVGGVVSWSGWAVDVQINARNSYGGYTGFESERVLFENGEVYKLPYGYAQFSQVY